MLLRKIKFRPLFILSMILSFNSIQDLRASWTHDNILKELENCSPQTIQLYMDLNEQITDPNQLAALLNLAHPQNQIAEQIPQTIQSQWTFQEIHQKLLSLNNDYLNQLHPDLKDQTNDPNFLAETLGLVKDSSSNFIPSFSPNDELTDGVLKASRLERLKEINKESRNFDNQDVHQFNRLLVLPHKDFVLETAKAQGLVLSYSLDTIISKLKAKKSNKFNITVSVHILKQHLASAQIDSETGLNVINLLSTVWSACEKLENKGNLFQLHNGQKVNAIDYFAWSLEENIATQGGCFPGFSGRFFRDLFTLMMFLD